jgi:hypothetical protein
MIFCLLTSCVELQTEVNSDPMVESFSAKTSLIQVPYWGGNVYRTKFETETNYIKSNVFIKLRSDLRIDENDVRVRNLDSIKIDNNAKTIWLDIWNTKNGSYSYGYRDIILDFGKRNASINLPTPKDRYGEEWVGSNDDLYNYPVIKKIFREDDLTTITFEQRDTLDVVEAFVLSWHKFDDYYIGKEKLNIDVRFGENTFIIPTDFIRSYVIQVLSDVPGHSDFQIGARSTNFSVLDE